QRYFATGARSSRSPGCGQAVTLALQSTVFNVRTAVWRACCANGIKFVMSSRLQVESRNNRGVNEMFRALRHRNFRLFWSGAFLSNTGTWMQAVAQGWLVLQLTNSPFWLGVDGFMATAPGLFLTLAGGVFADLVDRRRLLLYTQVIAGFAALALAMLVWTKHVSLWMVLGFSFITGCCMSLAGPSYQAMTLDLVGRA